MLDWDHNAYYHRLLLRHLPQPCPRVLDVGCGSGALATQLAQRAEHVDALDRSPEMLEAARQATPSNVQCVLADAMAEPLPGEDYDAIVSISALHHMPLHEALRALTAALRPGGVLAVVAVPRTNLAHELPLELVAAAGHRLLGTLLLTARSVGSKDWLAKDSTHATMPVVLDPPLSTREVREHAAAVLPGARVRRLVFWRYLLLWRKPIDTQM